MWYVGRIHSTIQILTSCNDLLEERWTNLIFVAVVVMGFQEALVVVTFLLSLPCAIV
jgi:hypothetical protein